MAFLSQIIKSIRIFWLGTELKNFISTENYLIQLLIRLLAIIKPATILIIYSIFSSNFKMNELESNGILKLKFPSFNTFHLNNYMYILDENDGSKFKYINETKDYDAKQLPFSLIFNSIEVTTSAVLNFFNQRVKQLSIVNVKDYVNDGKNYPTILSDISYNGKYFKNILQTKCYDGLSSFQDYVLDGLIGGDGCCTVRYEKPTILSTKDKIIENVDEKLTDLIVDEIDEYEFVETDEVDDHNNSTKKIKRNYGISYSQGIIHNVYFKFVSYIFCNQITTMSLNVYRKPSTGEKSDGSRFDIKGGLFNCFGINRNHLKMLRTKFYRNGIKFIDSDYILKFNEIVLAFLHQDDGSSKNEGFVLYCNGFDTESINNLVKCYHKLGFNSAHSENTGNITKNK